MGSVARIVDRENRTQVGIPHFVISAAEVERMKIIPHFELNSCIVNIAFARQYMMLCAQSCDCKTELI